MNKIPALIISVLMASAMLAIACAQPAATVKPKPPDNGATAQTSSKPTAKPPDLKDILGPKEAAVSENTSFICWVTDPDGRKLTFTWAVNAGSIVWDGRNGTWMTPGKPGTYTMSVKVVNDAGLEASMSKDFKVGTAPETHQSTDSTVYLKLDLPGNELTRMPAACLVNTTREIQCNIAGQDSAQLTFKWNSPIGRLSGNGLAEGKASRVGWIAPGTPGQYTVGVTVTDKSGRSAMGEVIFDVGAQ